MQLPILSGIYTDGNSDFRTSYPRNLVPVVKSTGLSDGYLRPADGIIAFGSNTGPGADRGGVNWYEKCYRVMGETLVRIEEDGVITTLGSVGGEGQVSLAYSFDYLAVVTDKKMFILDRADNFEQVTGTYLGEPITVIWIDNYFMVSDEDTLAVSNVGDPTSWEVLKYASSEVDPDKVKAVLKLRNEAYAVNRYTIEPFDNIGGAGFPFQRIEGAHISRGSVGSFSCCVFSDSISFLGSGRNEALAIWSGVNGGSIKLSTREVDQILAGYDYRVLEQAVLETRIENDHNQLWVRLPDQTLVFDASVSKAAETAVWFSLSAGITSGEQYPAQNTVFCYNKALVGHPKTGALGELVGTVSSQWGSEIGWDFSTPIIYSKGDGAIFHQIELVGTPGRTVLGTESTIWTKHSLDGLTWSQERSISVGKEGDRTNRMAWFQQGHMRNYRIQSFRGTSESHVSIARLEAKVEPLNG